MTSEEPEVEQLVNTVLLCLISIMVAPVTPTEPELVFAEQPVNSTEPKSAKLTKSPPDSKSSTIHSALYSQRDPSLPWLLKVCVTDLPVVLFSMTAVPPVLPVR